MQILTREHVLSIDSRSSWKTVEVPEWGGSVYIKPLTVREMIDFSTSVGAGESDNALASLHMVLASVVDDNGDPLFESTAQIEALPHFVVQRFVDAISELQGFTEDAVAEQAQNMLQDPLESTSTGSAGTSG